MTNFSRDEKQSQQNGRLEILVTLYSAQPYKPQLPVLCRQRKQDFIFYFIILYKCTLQPATCMEKDDEIVHFKERRNAVYALISPTPSALIVTSLLLTLTYHNSIINHQFFGVAVYKYIFLVNFADSKRRKQ